MKEIDNQLDSISQMCFFVRAGINIQGGQDFGRTMWAGAEIVFSKKVMKRWPHFQLIFE